MLMVASTRRLADLHRLEPTLERRILFDVLPVLVERGRANGVQLAASQERLEHVGGVERPFGGACADDRVQLVDEEHDFTLGIDDFLEHGLEAILELTAVLRAGDERAHVEGDDALLLEPFGHVAAHDALRQAFDDGGLADAGLADQDGIVLGASREHLDDATDFLVASDHRVELALAGELGEVAAVLLERLVLVLGILIGHTLAATNARQRLEHLVARHLSLLQLLDRERLPGLAQNSQQQDVRC